MTKISQELFRLAKGAQRGTIPGWGKLENLGHCVEELEAERKALRDALQWYVDHDETNDEPGNDPFLEGRRRALKALGLEE